MPSLVKQLLSDWLKRNAEYASKLKGGARDVLSEYQDDPAFINEILRGVNTRPHAVEHLKEVLPPVKEAFRGAPPIPVSGLSLYRAGPRESYPAGGIAAADRGLVSTSRDWNVPDDFLGYYERGDSVPLKMTVKIPEGAQVLDLAGLSPEWRKQAEVLLPPGVFTSTRADTPVLARNLPWYDPRIDTDQHAVAMYLGERNYAPDIPWLNREGFYKGGLVQ